MTGSVTVTMSVKYKQPLPASFTNLNAVMFAIFNHLEITMRYMRIDRYSDLVSETGEIKDDVKTYILDFHCGEVCEYACSLDETDEVMNTTYTEMIAEYEAAVNSIMLPGLWLLDDLPNGLSVTDVNIPKPGNKIYITYDY